MGATWGEGEPVQQGPDGSWWRWEVASGRWVPTPPPVGAPAIPPPPPPRYAFRPIDGVGRAVAVLLALTVAVAAAAVLSDLVHIRLIGRILSGHVVGRAEARVSDRRQQAIAGVELLLMLATGIVFLAWFRRAYENAESFGVSGLRYSAGWAVGAWFVPVLNLIRPMQIADDVVRASDAPGEEWKVAPPPAVVHWWWAAWLAANIVAWGSRWVGRSDDLAALRARTELLLVSELLLAAAGVLAIIVVSRTTAAQEQRAVSARTAPSWLR